MPESRPSLASALEAARQGITQAQEQVRQAGARRALLGAGDAAGPGAPAAVRQPGLVEDMVTLTQGRQAVRANAATVNIVSGVSEEVVNLGRRIDVKA